MFDKNGVVIKPGQTVRIANKRRDCNFTGIIKEINGLLKIKHTDEQCKGKYSSVSTWIDAIWWRSDTPENFIEVRGI